MQEVRYVKLVNVDPTNIHLMPLLEMYRELIAYDYQFLRNSLEINPDTMEQLTTEAFLAVETLVLAKAGDKLVGFVAMSRDDPESISEMFVSTEYRRKGIGRQLFTELKSMIKGSLKVNTVYGNEASLKFYQSLGFIPVTVGMSEPV